MFKKSCLIKIPKNVSIYIDSQKKLCLLRNNGNNSLINVNFDVLRFIKIKNKREFIYINPVHRANETLYKDSVLSFKRALTDISSNSCKKLKLKGIGYKVSIIKNEVNNVIHLKLGYSHSIYFKLPQYVAAKLTKNNVLFLFSNSAEKLSLVAELIKNCKRPDPYKGKGILYVNEKLNLKVGKKS